MEKQVGYKVVKKYGKHYCSVISHLKRIYKAGNIISRRKGCGPMAIFCTRQAAKRFARTQQLYDGRHYILRCEYGESKEQKLYYPVKLLGDGMRLGLSPDRVMCEMEQSDCPKETRFADWIHFNKYPTLLKKEIN